MEIIIEGLRPASKKNHRRNFRGISLPSKAYEKFHVLVGEFMMPWSHLNITRPCRIDVQYFLKGNYKQDLDNALSAIFDCLVDYRVIEDDNLIEEISARKICKNKDWKIVINLEEITDNT